MRSACSFDEPLARLPRQTGKNGRPHSQSKHGTRQRATERLSSRQRLSSGGASRSCHRNKLVGQVWLSAHGQQFRLVLKTIAARPPTCSPTGSAGGSGGPLCALRRAASHAAEALKMRMIAWIGRSHLNLRQDVSLGPVDFRGKRLRPVIVTEQQADPVELLYKAFQRLDAEQRRRLLKRIVRPKFRPSRAPA
jgi:hypothetical protein